jgi:hypothetical protein
MPQTTFRQRQHFERAHWSLRRLHGAALRAAEAAIGRTGDLVQRRGKWWLRVIGSGRVEGDVPISDTLMLDIGRYREFMGLPALPAPNEAVPLIVSLGGDRERKLTPTALYLIVKEVFELAADAIAGVDAASADILRRAWTHWLRNTPPPTRPMPSPTSDSSRKIYRMPRSRRRPSTGTRKTTSGMCPPRGSDLGWMTTWRRASFGCAVVDRRGEV